MKTSKVNKWISKNQEKIGLENPEVICQKSGESNHNFVLKSCEEKYILRVSREVSRENRLENEAEKLEFLKNERIEHVPENIFFEKETEIGTVLIETFVGEEDLDSESMTAERLRSLAEEVASIHSIPVAKYSNYSSEKIAETSNLRQIFRNDFKKWSRKPYLDYQKNAKETDPRIEKFFRKQKELLETVPDIEVDKGLVHGDLGFNIRATEDQVFIVDWEFCRVDYPENEILYCFEHEGLNQDQREIFLAEYREHRELGDKFEVLRNLYPGFLAFNDAIWAANRIEIEPEKEDEHRRRLESKLEKLEKFYDKRSL